MKKPSNQSPKQEVSKSAKPNGRPPKVLNWDEVRKLAAIQCTVEEIAAFCGCSRDTLDAAAKRDHGQTFSTIYEDLRQHGRISLRRSMFQSAQKGNTTMQIFLSKQKTFLGFSDKVDQTVEHSGTIQSSSMNQETLKKIHANPRAAELALELAEELATTEPVIDPAPQGGSNGTV